MKRKEILNRIDDMNLFKKDYNTLKHLLINADDKFFVKVLEGIFEGELFISDFERIFSDENYNEILEQNFRTQELLKKEVDRLLEYRRNTLGDTAYTINNIQGKLALVPPNDGESYATYYTNIKNEVRSDLIYQLLYSTESDSDVVRNVKLRLLEKLEDPTSGITEEDILLFARDYMLPISYEHQILTQIDKEFMVENRLTEMQMKKIKALSIFLRTKIEGGV